MQILSPTMTKRAKCTVPTLFKPVNIASLFSAIAFAASARPIGDLILSGMIRFIMHWRLSPGWIDRWGPPGRGFTGMRHAQKGTRINDARRLNTSLSGNPFTNRSNQPSSPAIGSTPLEGTPTAHFARNFISAPAGMEDRIPGGLDATREMPGIETDAFASGVLILGDIGERKGTHDDLDSVGRPRLCGVVERIARLADRHHQHEPGRPPPQAVFKFLAQIIIGRRGSGLVRANACDRLPGKANGAAYSMGIFHHEGVNGVIARAGIAHRRADHLGLDHSQLSEPVPVGVSECPRVCVRGFIRVRVASRLLELQQVDNLPPRRLLLNSLLPCDLGELEKVPNIADEEFAERRGDQVGCRLALQVETCRHSPTLGPSIMPVRSPRALENLTDTS